jgi:hypothetical protein
MVAMLLHLLLLLLHPFSYRWPPSHTSARVLEVDSIVPSLLQYALNFKKEGFKYLKNVVATAVEEKRSVSV